MAWRSSRSGRGRELCGNTFLTTFLPSCQTRRKGEILRGGSERSGPEPANIAKSCSAVFGSCGLRSRRADGEEESDCEAGRPVYIVFLLLCWMGEDKALCV